MNKIQKIQKFFHTDKKEGRVLFIICAYVIFSLIWFNIFIPYMYDGVRIFFDFSIIPLKSSFSFFTVPVFEIIKSPLSIFNIQIYFSIIMPVLSFIFLKKFIFKVININSKIIKYFFYFLNFLFVLIMMRIFILAIVSNIHPNFF